KFTAQGEVLVEVVCLSENAEHATLRITITDTGIGISPEDQERLFKPFVQADGATTRRFGGTGLGLSICKSLLNRMGGSDIAIESRPGEGSTFLFTLTLEKQGDDGIPIVPKTIVHRKVLVVDDNATNRMILDRLLRDWGTNACAAESAPQGLAMLRAALREGEPFDLVIMDMNMPDMDGIMMAQAMSQEDGLAATPRILLSSGGAVSERDRTLAGIRHSLTKPVRQSLLFDALVSSLDGGWIKPNVAKSQANEPMPNFAGQRILLVEDNAVNQKVALKMLECFQVDSHLSGNGREALEELGCRAYDLVLMDCHMPEMDGYSATRALRDRERLLNLERTPVIALTANALAEDREKCLKAGMDDHLAKPLMLDDLSKMLLRWLGSPAIVVEQTQAIGNGFWDRQAALRQLGGDTGFLVEMKHLYVTEASSLLERLQSNDSPPSAAIIAEAAHALKGMAPHFCAQGLEDIAGQVEMKAHANEIGTGDTLLLRLIEEVEGLMAALMSDV
ncbi:MAG: response regulator, partial [Candidatus Methylumidiphilus sp.]